MNKRYILLIVLLLAMVPVVTAWGIYSFNTARAKALYDDGQNLLANAEYSSAIEKFQTLVNNFPEGP